MRAGDNALGEHVTGGRANDRHRLLRRLPHALDDPDDNVERHERQHNREKNPKHGAYNSQDLLNTVADLSEQSSII